MPTTDLLLQNAEKEQDRHSLPEPELLDSNSEGNHHDPSGDMPGDVSCEALLLWDCLPRMFSSSGMVCLHALRYTIDVLQAR